MAYAENTEVAVEKSVGEIVALIKKAGANRIAQIEEPEYLQIQFFLHDRLLRFSVGMPSLEEMPTKDGRGAMLSRDQRNNRAAQACRQRARALLLVIKAKLESVESGVESFEEAFLANVVMPDGRTVGEMAQPAIADAYTSGKQPTLFLTGPESGR